MCFFGHPFLIARNISTLTKAPLSRAQTIVRTEAGRVQEQANFDAANITANKNTIPFDTQSVRVTSGVRLGTPAVTTRGMGPDEMKVIADCIADCVFDFANKKDEVARKVEELTKKFPLYE